MATHISRRRLTSVVNPRCWYCGVAIVPERGLNQWAIDHVHPLSQGGLRIPSNEVLCCRFCNSQKGTKSLEEYRSYMLLKTSPIRRSRFALEQAIGAGGLADFAPIVADMVACLLSFEGEYVFWAEREQ